MTHDDTYGIIVISTRQTGANVTLSPSDDMTQHVEYHLSPFYRQAHPDGLNLLKLDPVGPIWHKHQTCGNHVLHPLVEKESRFTNKNPVENTKDVDNMYIDLSSGELFKSSS